MLSLVFALILVAPTLAFHHPVASSSPNPRLLSYLKGDIPDLPTFFLEKTDDEMKQ